MELIGGVGAAPKPLGMKDNWTVKLAQTGGKKVQTLAPGTASAAYITFSTRQPGVGGLGRHAHLGWNVTSGQLIRRSPARPISSVGRAGTRS